MRKHIFLSFILTVMIYATLPIKQKKSTTPYSSHVSRKIPARKTDSIYRGFWGTANEGKTHETWRIIASTILFSFYSNVMSKWFIVVKACSVPLRNSLFQRISRAWKTRLITPNNWTVYSSTNIYALHNLLITQTRRN